MYANFEALAAKLHSALGEYERGVPQSESGPFMIVYNICKSVDGLRKAFKPDLCLYMEATLFAAR